MDLIGPDFSNAQFWTEFDAAGERLVMPLRRGWGAMGWALGGFLLFAFNHFVQLKDEMRGFDWLMVLLVGLGFLRLLAEVMTNLLAREMLRVELGDLVHGWRILGYRRERRYRLKEIRSLAADRDINPPKMNELISPFNDFGKIGTVNFDYGDQTVSIGAALDRAHGEQVVRWITLRAPRSIVEN